MTTTITRSPVRHWPGIIATALTATVAGMPGFTVGALAPAIGADLHISRSAAGLAMSLFYAATAFGSPVAKRVAARLPVPTVLTVAALVASAVMLVASRATGPGLLTATLLVGGLSNALVQPVASRLIAARVPERRRSLAAGMIGAALGAAALVPGLLVALVLPAYGWRTALLVAGVAALVPAALAPLARAPGGPQPAKPKEAGDRHRTVGRVLVLWALAAALSATGNNAVATYFVELGTHSGLGTTVTGNLLSLSALFAIAVRITAGALTDRAPHRNAAVIVTMMLSGGLGLALIAIGTSTTFVLGAILAFSAGWGWTGLLLATTLRLVPGRTEDAGHTVQIGVYAGATIAPFTFGALSSAFGFPATALLAAVAAVAAAVAMAAGALLLRRAG
ncbi:MFS transporter [Nonomuraea sp. LP-02]|uniref:MFS transporter n=1 Tax=Nonomuraea sp. LP-02 TaxID=3097960 RepID=UPI002E36FC52|nr:MFS transporter [Nonomuraea sp. LP-02]MED7931624.1 MFS transporter [Nonomuraea sp. LP-02]